MSRPSRSQRSTKLSKGGAVACLLCVGVLLVALLAPSARGEDRVARGFVVIVNPANPVRSVSDDFLARAFFKQMTRWDHGEAIRPVDLHFTSPVRAAFSNRVLKRPPQAVRGYWLQRIFSGRDVPPLELDSEAGVIRYVLASPGAVGYVSASTNPAPAKILTVQ